MTGAVAAYACARLFLFSPTLPLKIALGVWCARQLLVTAAEILRD